MHLKERILFITGAGSGIGIAMKKLAYEEARIIAADENSESVHRTRHEMLGRARDPLPEPHVVMPG